MTGPSERRELFPQLRERNSTIDKVTVRFSNVEACQGLLARNLFGRALGLRNIHPLDFVRAGPRLIERDFLPAEKAGPIIINGETVWF